MHCYTIKLLIKRCKNILNWTAAALICFIAFIITSTASIVTIIHYVKTNYKHTIYMSICWANFALCYLFQGLAELYLSELLWLICCYAYIPLGYFLVILLDSLSRTSIDPVKISIVSIISTTVVITSFEPNAIEIIRFSNGQLGLAATGSFLISQVALYLLFGSFSVFYFTKIAVKSPNSLKFYSSLLLFGVAIHLIGAVTIGLGLNEFLPSSDALFVAIGTAIFTIALIQEPKLAYILPFRAYNVIVLDSNAGIPLFSYTWDTPAKKTNESLFSGFLSAISEGLDEILNVGYIREINLDEGVLILKKCNEHHILYSIFASGTLPSLRHGLICFFEKFHKKYFEYLDEPIRNQTKFKSADKLIPECFPFVPKYDNDY